MNSPANSLEPRQRMVQRRNPTGSTASTLSKTARSYPSRREDLETVELFIPNRLGPATFSLAVVKSLAPHSCVPVGNQTIRFWRTRRKQLRVHRPYPAGRDID